MADVKEKTIAGIPEEELFESGHSACEGCGEAIAIRHILKAAGKNTIVAQATGCPEVFSSLYPHTSWKIPWIHVAFENAAAVASGIREALNHQGKKFCIYVQITALMRIRVFSAQVQPQNIPGQQPLLLEN